MILECKVSEERWSDEDGRVYFKVEIGLDAKQGYITGEAIRALQVPYTENWDVIFEQHRSAIQRIAHAKWRKNPLNDVIVIGSGDF